MFSQTEYQVSPGKYWIQFTDKDNSTYSISHPSEFLSPRAIERRNNQGISISVSDLPVTQVYVDSLEALGIEIWSKSKWLNGVVIISEDLELLDTIENLSFVEELAKPTNPDKIDNHLRDNKYKQYKPISTKENFYNYGFFASKQITIHSGEELHNLGYRGSNMLIAIIDAGFKGLYNDQNIAFDSLLENSQIKFTHDFVLNAEDINVGSTHGMSVLSLIGGNAPGFLVGTAPEADFALIRSEDAPTEHIVEELYWAAGAEYADSIGADVVNVSLGYTDYDTAAWTHIPSDFDGNTTWITRAANIAAEKGMLVVVSSGNNGNSEVPNIGAPSDSPNVLSIGAIYSDSVFAHFSSRGPTFDNRIKPDVVAVGASTYLQLDSLTGFGDGTSFSSPIICGLSACLWQAHPNATNFEIKDAIIASSHLYNTPNDSLGYGIPNFLIAHNLLTEQDIVREETEIALKVYPNPFENYFELVFNNVVLQNLNITIYNSVGQEVYNRNYNESNYQKTTIRIDDFSPSEKGIFIVRATSNQKVYSTKLLKN